MKIKYLLLLSMKLIFVSCNAQDLIKLTTQEFRDSVEIWASNLTYGSVALRITYPQLVNMKSIPESPYLTLHAGEKSRVALIAVIKQGQGYSYSFSYESNIGRYDAKPDDTLYDLPYQSGISAIVGQGYHGKFSHFGAFSYSLDFEMPIGTTVCAAREGTVIAVRDEYDGAGLTQYYKEHTNHIKIEHSDGTIGEYAHIKQGGAIVKEGDIVKKNQAIAYSGNVGYSDGPHLHFHVFMNVDGAFQTIPVKFNTTKGETLVQGETYIAR